MRENLINQIIVELSLKVAMVNNIGHDRCLKSCAKRSTH